MFHYFFPALVEGHHVEMKITPKIYRFFLLGLFVLCQALLTKTTRSQITGSLSSKKPFVASFFQRLWIIFLLLLLSVFDIAVTSMGRCNLNAQLSYILYQGKDICTEKWG